MELMHIEMKIKADCVEAFAEVTRKNAAATRAEPGNLRFDVTQSLTDPTVFFVLEAYVDGAAKGAHFKSAHFDAWQQAVGDLVEDTHVTGCRPVFPVEGAW